MLRFISFFGSLSKIAFHNPRDFSRIFVAANSAARYIKTFFRINWPDGGHVQRTPRRNLSPLHFRALWA